MCAGASKPHALATRKAHLSLIAVAHVMQHLIMVAVRRRAGRGRRLRRSWHAACAATRKACFSSIAVAHAMQNLVSVGMPLRARREQHLRRRQRSSALATRKARLS